MGLLGYGYNDGVTDPVLTGVGSVCRTVTSDTSTVQRWPRGKLLAKNNGCVFVARHVFTPTQATASGIAAQAAFFASQNAAGGGDLVVLDVITLPGATVANITAWQQAVRGYLPGIKVGLYCDAATWTALNNTAAAGDLLYIQDTAHSAGNPSVSPTFTWSFHEYAVQSAPATPAAATYNGSFGALRTFAAEPGLPVAVSDISTTAVTGTDATGSTTTAVGGGGGGAVSSVNGHTGAVVLGASDVGAAATANNLSDLASASTARTNLGLGSAATVNTPVPIGSGGTGQTAQQAAINALTGTQSAGRYLRSDGTNATLATVQAADVPILNQNTTGTASNVTGTVAIGNGGTGQTTQQAAMNTLAGGTTTGQYLRGNGTNVALSPLQSADITAGGGLLAANNLSDVANLATSRNTLRPWEFDVTSPTYGAKGDGKQVVDGAITTGTNTLACTTSTPFTVNDVGKAILVKGAGVTTPSTSNATTLVTTISGFTDSGHVTLTANASTTITSATVMWATDDTAAIQAAINAAVTYANAHSFYAEVVVPPSTGAFYGIAGALVTGGSTLGNAQLTLPVIPVAQAKVTLVIRGSNLSSATRHWQQTVPPVNASCLVSFGVFATAAAQTTNINNNGNPAVIGGPTGKNGYGTNALLYSNMMIVIQGLTILTTHSNSGLTYGALNFNGIACANIFDTSYGTAGTVGGAVNDYNAVSVFATGSSLGILLPANGNNDNNQIRNLMCGGGYTYALFVTEHTDIHGACLLYCWSGLCLVGAYADSGAGSTGALHAMNATQVSVEACSFHINVIGPGASGVGPIFHGVIDTEAVPQLRDTTSGTGLAAALGEVKHCGAGSTFTLTNPTGLQLINERQVAGPVATPAFTVGTAQINTFWRWATVTIVTGGVNMTTIQTSNLMGGAAAPTLTTVVTATAGVLPVGTTFRVGPGAWWVVNTSGSPTAPTFQWILD